MIMKDITGQHEQKTADGLIAECLLLIQIHMIREYFRL